MGIISLVAFLLTIYSQVSPDTLRFMISPPDSTLTVILDTSAPMAEAYLGGLTRWQVASEVIHDQLDSQKRPVNQIREVAIWSQRGTPNATGGGCKKDFSLLTKRYMLPDRVNVNSLLSGVTLAGRPSPGQALWDAVKKMPRSIFKSWKHEAFVLSSSGDTCSGQRPIKEICDNLKDIADRWSPWPYAEFSHIIIVVDMDAGHIGSDPRYCADRNVTVWKVDLDPKDPTGSGRVLCEANPALCDLRINQITVEPATPAAATMAPLPTPSSTPEPKPTLRPTSAPLMPSTVPSATNMPTATPQPTQTMTPTPSPTQGAGTSLPTPTPSLKLRAPSGRSATVRNDCLTGSVIGAIGLLPQYSQQMEAEVPLVPEDLHLLSVNGCIRVFTGIMGRPDRGFSGYVQAEEVCVVRSSYDYWKDLASFYQTAGIDGLRRCAD
jgi:hypothetical protein